MADSAELSRRDLLRAGATVLLAASTVRARASTAVEAAEAESVGLPGIPYGRSKAIKGIRWLSEPRHSTAGGDVWTCTWADDGNLYSVADDTAGWNLSIYRIEGMPPQAVVTRVNEMKEYDPAGKGNWWKGAGLTCIDGVLYLGIYAQSNPRKGSAAKISFNADHASILKSTDHGLTWTPTATTGTAMFPGKEFPTPFFVQYGRDYAGAIDEYVYVVSNDGGWNNWNRMMLARVPRARMAGLNRADWEFFAGSGRRNAPRWDGDVRNAAPIFEHKGYTSMTGIQYVPAVKRFILGQWAYVAMKGGGDRVDACPEPALWPDLPKYTQADQAMLCLYEAPRPWGPWRLFHAQPSWGPAFYNPNFPAKWFESGGRRMWIVEGGNYRGPKGGYNFTLQPLELML